MAPCFVWSHRNKLLNSDATYDINASTEEATPVHRKLGQTFQSFLAICLLIALQIGFWNHALQGQETNLIGIDYQVDLSQAITRYVTVTMESTATESITQLMMATWTPGSYLVREYAQHVDRIAATDAAGNPLPLEKTRKNRWEVQTTPEERFRVTYRLYCNEASVRTNLVNRTCAVINGAATFITVPEYQQSPHRVKFLLPEYWNESASAMARVDGQPNHYRAANFDELVDSPVVAGRITTYPFDVGGVPHFLVNVNEKAGWDAETAVKDLASVVAAHQAFWGIVPYDRYYFLNVFVGGGGGLEHDHCCLMMNGQFEVRDKTRYLDWLSLASHEFFHTWNVRRLRPKALVKYDYEAEVYTPALWIAEGLTSYYEDLLLVRAGIMTQEEFLKSLGRQISSLQKTDGRLIQTLRDSSHDAWIKFYGSATNKKDSQISYYTKGAVVGFLLDMEIRASSGGTNSLDSVLREFYQRYAGQVGYTIQDFRDLCSQHAGKDLTDWLRLAVDTTEELDYQTAANWLGIQIGAYRPTQRSSNEATSEHSLKNEQTDRTAASPDNNAPNHAAENQTQPSRGRHRGPKPVPWIGVGVPDSPATLAGLADTDEIIGINGKRVSSLDSDLKRHEIGETVKLLIARDGQLMEIEVVVGSRSPTTDWSVTVSKDATEPQQNALQQWLAPAATLPSGDGTTPAQHDG